MAVSSVPPANNQIPALTTISVATTWCIEAVWCRTTRLVFQAFKVHTRPGKLALHPMQTKSGNEKTDYRNGHLRYCFPIKKKEILNI